MRIAILSLFILANAVSGTTYYVKTDGNDDAAGTSDATAWKTINKINAFSFNAGDDVYFKCGGTWTVDETAGHGLIMDWSGVDADDYATIGAYHMDGGSEVHGISGNKPILSGTKPASWEDAVTDYQNNALVYSSSKNHISVENVRCINSKGHTISFAYGSYIRLSGVDCANVFNTGIKCYGINAGVIENCVITGTGLKRIEAPGTNWGASIACLQECNNITVKDNTVYNNEGEGIGFYHKSYDCIVEHNAVYGNANCNIYVDRGINVHVRYNLVYGAADGLHITDGIGINSETGNSDSINENNEVYDNHVAWCYRGIFFNSPKTGSSIINARIYNNTIVDCSAYNLFIGDIPSFSGCEVKNNISWIITGDGRQAGVPSASGITFDYNLWSSTPDADAQGAHDPGYALPSLSKTSGWRSITGGSLTGADFVLQSTSPAIDKGVALGASYATDYSGTARPQGSGWDIGAHEFTAGTGISNSRLTAAGSISGTIHSTGMAVYNLQGARVPVNGGMPTGIYIVEVVGQGKTTLKKVRVDIK